MRPQLTKRFTSLTTFGVLTMIAMAPATAQVIPEQGRSAHFFHQLPSVPGRIGAQQLLRVPNAAGYFQPVELRGPKGSLVSMASDGGFLPDRKESIKAGLQMGHVYRFRIGNVELLEGHEVFPTIELVNRLHPPPGMEGHFPIPVEVTKEEFELAVRGHMITRVIYLEDPNNALPVAQQKTDQQRYFDIDRRFDLLQTADRLGRPMAILRLGSRVPLHDDESGFAYSGSPAQVYPEVEADTVIDKVETVIDRPAAQPPAPTARLGAPRSSVMLRSPVNTLPARGPAAVEFTPAPARLPYRIATEAPAAAPVINATR